jgi:hypothetical protein
MTAALAGQQPGERGFARARRTIKNHRAQPIGLEQSPQQFSFSQKMLLADELLERNRPHPRGQRLRFAAVRLFACIEKGHVSVGLGF